MKRRGFFGRLLEGLTVVLAFGKKTTPEETLFIDPMPEWWHERGGHMYRVGNRVRYWDIWDDPVELASDWRRQGAWCYLISYIPPSNKHSVGYWACWTGDALAWNPQRFPLPTGKLSGWDEAISYLDRQGPDPLMWPHAGGAA